MIVYLLIYPFFRTRRAQPFGRVVHKYGSLSETHISGWDLQEAACVQHFYLRNHLPTFSNLPSTNCGGLQPPDQRGIDECFGGGDVIG